MTENQYFVTTSEKELQAIFELFDFNKNGLISREGFQKIMESQGFYPTNSEIKTMLDHTDDEKNNSQDLPKDDADIDFKTFVNIANRRINQAHVKKSDAQAAFSVLDKDNDGLISRGDLKKTLQAYLHNPTELEIDELMKEAGVEIDEDIDFSQFILAFEST